MSLEEVRNVNIDPEKIAESFQYLADCEVKLVKNEETLCHISSIEVLADNGGLSLDQFGLIVEQLTKLQCSPVLSRRLINTLTPASSIPASILVDLVLWGLGDRKLTESTIVLPVLRVVSLCLQYDCVEDKQELVELYEVFLSLLTRDKLTSAVADLLQLLTVSGEVVTSWRARTVLRCQSVLGSSHSLDTLLWIYKQWRPDLIPNCRAPASSVMKPTTILAKRFHSVWERRMDRNLSETGSANLWISGIRTGTVFKKSMRTTLLPSNDILPTSRGIRKSKIEPAKNLSDLKTLNELIDNIHNIQLPANVVSMLGNSACVQVLALDQNLVERFSINIYHVLKNEFLITEDRKISPAEKKRKLKRRNTLLGLLVKLQEHIQQGIPVVGRFLTEYLEFWDGKSHFEHFLRLISQLQITDYKELHDCIISPIISKHFQNYNQIEQLVVLSCLHRLLRQWAIVEMDRFSKHRRSIFPWNTINCTDALESMYHLTVSIGETSRLALSLARQAVENTHLMTTQILTQYRTSQVLMSRFEVPLRVDLPSPFLYDSLFSHSADLLSMSCQYILTAKKEVLPALKRYFRDAEMEFGSGHPTTMIMEEMLSEESKEELLTATRDFLVFLSPGQVNLTPSSILRQGWDLPEGEESLKEKLYITSHPAILPFALNYVDSLDLDEEDKQSAWIELSTEQEDDSTWETNICIDQGRPKFASSNFYGSKKPQKQAAPASKKVATGNIFDFLKLLSHSLPAVNDLIMEYKQKSTSSISNIPSLPQKESDQRSIISQQTVDSGVETLLSRTKRRSGERSENVASKRSRKSSPPASRIPVRETRRSKGMLTDASNMLK